VYKEWLLTFLSGMQLALKHVAGKVSLVSHSSRASRAALLVPTHIPPTIYRIPMTGDGRNFSPYKITAKVNTALYR